jgi:hypothetical protein
MSSVSNMPRERAEPAHPVPPAKQTFILIKLFPFCYWDQQSVRQLLYTFLNDSLYSKIMQQFNTKAAASV